MTKQYQSSLIPSKLREEAREAREKKSERAHSLAPTGDSWVNRRKIHV